MAGLKDTKKGKRKMVKVGNGLSPVGAINKDGSEQYGALEYYSWKYRELW